MVEEANDEEETDDDAVQTKMDELVEKVISASQTADVLKYCQFPAERAAPEIILFK